MLYFFAQKKQPEASGVTPMPQLLLSLNLCAEFHPVMEREHYPAVRIDRCVIHKPVKQLTIEIHRQIFCFAKFCREPAENVILDFLPLLLFSKLSS